MYTKNNSNKRQLGNHIETIVCDYLSEKGYKILSKNYRCPFGEIDIIAKDENYITFIEVKYRKNVASGYPIEAVNHRKQQKIIKTSLYYITQNHLSLNSNYRYDIVSVIGSKVHILKNAFTI